MAHCTFDMIASSLSISGHMPIPPICMIASSTSIIIYVTIPPIHIIKPGTFFRRTYPARMIPPSPSVYFYAADNHKKSLWYRPYDLSMPGSHAHFYNQNHFLRTNFLTSSLFAAHLFAPTHHLLPPCSTLAFFTTMPSLPSPKRIRPSLQESTPLLALLLPAVSQP